jgi:hypothetical protein
MTDQHSGEMLVGLMRIANRILSSPNMHSLNPAPEEAELDRLRVLLGSGQETPLKAALKILIERLKSKNPDSAEVAAAMEEVKRLWPASGPPA